jgi:glutaredoxin
VQSVKEEEMGLIKIFTKEKCPRCPAVKEIGTKLKKEGVPVLNYDLDTIDGLAEASFYSIRSTPSIVIEDEEEREVISWRGVVPTLQEVKQHLFPLFPSLSPPETVS